MNLLWEKHSRIQYRKHRQCKNGRGFWKVQYQSATEAWPSAQWLTRNRNNLYEPYVCSECGLWHVGGTRIHPTLMYELGERAYWNLRWESERGTLSQLHHLFDRMATSTKEP